MRARFMTIGIALFAIAIAVFQSADAVAYQGESPQPNSDRSYQEALDENSQLHTVILLDSLLCLSEEQWAIALEVVGSQWDSAWNEEMQSMMLRIFGTGRLDIIQEIDWTKLESELRPRQRVAFSKLDELASIDFVDLLRRLGSPDVKVELAKYKRTLLRLTELKLDELTALVEPDESQLRVLKIAATGVSTRAARQWESCFERYSKSPDDRDIQREANVFIRRHPIHQCTTDKVWQRTLEKTLSAEQLRLVHEREANRLRWTNQQFLQDYVNFLIPNQCRLSRRQYQLLTELWMQELELGASLSSSGVENQIAMIKASKFTAILTEEQWTQFEPVLNVLKRQRIQRGE